MKEYFSEVLYISAGKVYRKEAGKMVKIGENISLINQMERTKPGHYLYWDKPKDNSAEELLNNFPFLIR